MPSSRGHRRRFRRGGLARRFPSWTDSARLPQGAPLYLVGGAVRDLLLGAAARRHRRGGRGRRRRGRAAPRRRGARARALLDREGDARRTSRSTSPAPAPSPIPSPGALPEVQAGRAGRGPGAPRLHRQRDGAAAAGRARADRPAFAGAPTWRRACCGFCTTAPSSTTRPGRCGRRATRRRFGFELEPQTAELLRDADLGTVSGDRRAAELLRLASEPQAAARPAAGGGVGAGAPAPRCRRAAAGRRSPARKAALERGRGAPASDAGRGARARRAARRSWRRRSRRGPPRESSWRAARGPRSWSWPGRWAPSGSTTTCASGAAWRWRSTAPT